LRQTHRRQLWFHSRRFTLRDTILRTFEAPCQSSTFPSGDRSFCRIAKSGCPTMTGQTLNRGRSPRHRTESSRPGKSPGPFRRGPSHFIFAHTSGPRRRHSFEYCRGLLSCMGYFSLVPYKLRTRQNGRMAGPFLRSGHSPSDGASIRAIRRQA